MRQMDNSENYTMEYSEGAPSDLDVLHQLNNTLALLNETAKTIRFDNGLANQFRSTLNANLSAIEGVCKDFADFTEGDESNE